MENQTAATQSVESEYDASQNVNKSEETKSSEPKHAANQSAATQPVESASDASTPASGMPAEGTPVENTPTEGQSSYTAANAATNPAASPMNGEMQGMNAMPGAPMNGVPVANNGIPGASMNGGMPGMPGMPGMQGGVQGMNNMVQRPGARRRPRFVPKPKREEDASFVERRNLLTATASTAKHQITRERKIAGNLPDWDPLPPSEILITR